MKRRERLGLALWLALVLALPFVPVQAAATFTFECADPSGAPVTGCDVYLDPDVHNGTTGTTLFHSTSAGKHTITLPDGAHRVAVVAFQRTSTGTNTSVIAIQTQPSGCQAGWAPISYQSWWSDTGQDPTFGSRHSHFDNVCWPVNNLIVRGTQTFTLPWQLHNQPAGAKVTRVRLKDYPGGRDIWVAPSLTANPFTATIDTDKLAAGRHEFRWAIYVTQPTGLVQLLSTRSEVCIRSCSPAYRTGTWQGNGSWYANDSPIGYVDARIHSVIPTSVGATPSPLITPVPTPAPTPAPTPTPAPSVCV